MSQRSRRSKKKPRSFLLISARSFCFIPLSYEALTWKGTVKGPNRIKEIVKYVKEGGLLYAGSWVTFNRRYSRGLWRRTAIREVLP